MKALKFRLSYYRFPWWRGNGDHRHYDLVSLASRICLPPQKKDCPKPIVKNLHMAEPVLMVLYTKNTGTNLSDPVEIGKFDGFEHGKK